MAEAKSTRSSHATVPQVPAERPSHSSLLTASVMAPALENTTRTANKIREELGLATHRYLLVTAGSSGAEDLVENVRIAVLRAMARTHETALRVEVREHSTRRLLCWAEGGVLFDAESVEELSPDQIVRRERRLLARVP